MLLEKLPSGLLLALGVECEANALAAESLASSTRILLDGGGLGCNTGRTAWTHELLQPQLRHFFFSHQFETEQLEHCHSDQFQELLDFHDMV